jgi:hypothetical protein
MKKLILSALFAVGMALLVPTQADARGYVSFGVSVGPAYGYYDYCYPRYYYPAYYCPPAYGYYPRYYGYYPHGGYYWRHHHHHRHWR